jgi:hypothetical protein
MPRRARVQQPHAGSSSARPTRLVVRRRCKVRSHLPIPFFLAASTTKCPPHVVVSCLCMRALDPAPMCVVRRRAIPVSSLVEMGSRRLPLCTAPRAARFAEPCAQHPQNTSSQLARTRFRICAARRRWDSDDVCLPLHLPLELVRLHPPPPACAHSRRCPPCARYVIVLCLPGALARSSELSCAVVAVALVRYRALSVCEIKRFAYLRSVN